MATPLHKLLRWSGTPMGVTVVSAIVNLVLALAKVAAGVVCNSQAILVDGLHTASDLLTDMVVVAGLRVSGLPADESHPYGHRRAITLATALLALTLMGLAGYVAYQSIIAFAEKTAAGIRPILPLVLALTTVAVKEPMYHVTVLVGRKVGDSSLMANAWHHRSDALSSIAVAIGLAGVVLGGEKWHFLDHLTALILVCFLGMVGLRIIREAVNELMDRAPSREATRVIEQSVVGTPGVLGFHGFRARVLGGKMEMDVHIQVDPSLTVRQGHDIAGNVRRQVILADANVVTVIVHVEPKQQ